MILKNDVKCRICSKIFCCSICRRKHEEKHIAGEKNSINIKKDEIPYMSSCPICNGIQYLFNINANNNDENLHIIQYHLPLKCAKCSKIFSTISDMSQHNKCTKSSSICNIQNIITSSNKDSKISCSTQTSPLTLNHTADTDPRDGALLMNFEWKLKKKKTGNYGESESFFASSSLLKNVSAISGSSILTTKNEHNMTKDGKLVRTTSTPMQDLFEKKKLNGSSSNDHVSSIYGLNSESDTSPSNLVNTPKSPNLFEIQRNRKYGINRCHKPVTPLRQVMVKNIRKAITEHGVNILNTNSCTEAQSLKLKHFENKGSPLDLRTSPALRRVHSEINERSASFENFNKSMTSTRRSFSISSNQTSQSIYIKSQSSSSLALSKLDTIYTTCRSIEVITTKLHDNTEVKRGKNISLENSLTITPKIGTSGSLKSKKTIDFQSPQLLHSPMEDDDVFSTPKLHFSSIEAESKVSDNNIRSINRSKENIESRQRNETYQNSFPSNSADKCRANNHIKLLNNKGSISSTKEKFWSLLSSVIPISSFSNCTAEDKKKPSLIKRCASIAGFLTKPKKTPDHNLKRKRNISIDLSYPSILQVSRCEFNSAKRLKRIQGRKPIERMRNSSTNTKQN